MSYLRYTFLALALLPLLLNAQQRAESLPADSIRNLDEIVVTGTRNETDIRHLPMTISVVGRQQIARNHEQSILPVLTEQVPGFFTTGRSILGYGISTGAAGGMSLRGIGGGGAGLLVLIDGHPQYMGLMGHPVPDTYQTMMAEKVEVVRGPASVLYGSNAMGGVINIVTRRQQEDGIRNDIQVGYGSYNTLLTEGVSRIRKGKFGSVVTASYNRTDGHRANMDFEQAGGYAKLEYDLHTAWKTFADVSVTHFNTSNPGTVSAPLSDNDSRITRGMASFSLENEYEKTSGALKFFYNWGIHEINDGYKEGEQPLDFRYNSDDRMMGISWYQSASFFEGNRITAGVDYRRFGGEAWNQFPGKRVDLADKTEHEVAGYAGFRQIVRNRLTLDAGIRLDHHSHTGTEWVPQGGVALRLPRSAELKAMISKGFRNPTIREMYMFNSRNPDLLPERIVNYELSYAQRLLNNAFTYGANLFYIRGSNTIQTVNRMNINTGKIRNHGVETHAAYRLGPAWQVSGNYSWLHMKYPVVSAPEHKLYLGIYYTRGRWSADTGVQYIHGLFTDTEAEAKENFLLWNIRGSYRLHKVAELFVRGENLLAQRYETLAGYPMPKATVIAGVRLLF